jgi:hypothetical protein
MIVVNDLGLMIERLLSPSVVLTLIVAGILYGRVLWAIDMREPFRMWAATALPGSIFIAVVGTIRGAQGSPTTLYPVLFVDWIIFANAGVFAVLMVRRWRARRQR